MNSQRPQQTRPGPDRDAIIDRLYEIAVEPSALEDLIDLWLDAPHDHANTTGRFGDSDADRSHIKRAQSVLQRGEAQQLDPNAILAPYGSLAALIIDRDRRVHAANVAAEGGFAAHVGRSVEQLDLPVPMRAALAAALRKVLQEGSGAEQVLKADLPTDQGALLFRVCQLPTHGAGVPLALVVSTKFLWRDELSGLLGRTFGLTQAEQSVVRLRVEGRDLSAIAKARGTSEGTVRGQIKSVMQKMNVRSQTDIVRMALTLGKFPPADSLVAEFKGNSPAPGWLETQVWKPFLAVDLPDGRKLTYHEMGPKDGNPVLVTHMGSCMVRWPAEMLRLAFHHGLRIICPIRAGYGHSDHLPRDAELFSATRTDTVHLLNELGIERLPYAAQGTDFPLMVDFAAHHPDRVSALFAIGGKPCLPGGRQIDGAGRWQRFFVSTARSAPHLVRFASSAVMAMSKSIGPEKMLRQLCKESEADLAVLQDEATRRVLVANIRLMAGPGTNAAQAFAREYVAFQSDWSAQITATKHIPTTVFLAAQDPTTNIGGIPMYEEVFPWLKIETFPDAGLALLFQKPNELIPRMAEAAGEV